MAKAILRLPTVVARTGLSRSTIYLRIKNGTFPLSVRIGSRAVGWLESDIDAWLTNLEHKARCAAAESESRG